MRVKVSLKTCTRLPIHTTSVVCFVLECLTNVSHDSPNFVAFVDIKNHKAALSKAVKKVGSQASLRLALTGTVVENRLAELHSCFDFALPNYLGTLKEFTSRFAKPIENKRDVEIIELLKRMTSCFMLRREKTDPSVISDLPDKIERKHYVKICPEQIALYESIRESVFDTMAANAAAPAGSGSKRNALVLKLLSDLKQICNHVRLSSHLSCLRHTGYYTRCFRMCF